MDAAGDAVAYGCVWRRATPPLSTYPVRLAAAAAAAALAVGVVAACHRRCAALRAWLRLYVLGADRRGADIAADMHVACTWRAADIHVCGVFNRPMPTMHGITVGRRRR